MQIIYEGIDSGVHVCALTAEDIKRFTKETGKEVYISNGDLIIEEGSSDE